VPPKRTAEQQNTEQRTAKGSCLFLPELLPSAFSIRQSAVLLLHFAPPPTFLSCVNHHLLPGPWLSPPAYPDGFGLRHEFAIDVMDVDFHKVNPIFDDKMAVALHRALEKSLNRPRNQQSLAAVRLPYWIPQDVLVDFELTR
jgi:hypothetical protein